VVGIANLFAGFQNRRDWPWPVFKSSLCNSTHLFSNSSKGFELAGYKKLSANSKAFIAKRLRTYEFSIKYKGTVKQNY
jgi:hypothetical protein